MKIIPIKILGKQASKPCYVDDVDFESVSKFSWVSNGGYAKTTFPRGKSLLMHRLILRSTDKQFVIDHKDRNKLNNQKSNLRLCSRSENQWNSSKRRNNKSGITGVFWNNDKLKWEATVTQFNKRLFLGRFDSKSEAGEVYKNWIKKNRGEFAYTE